MRVKILKLKQICLMGLLLSPMLLLAQWTPLGNDIDGEAINNQSGYAVGLSADGNTVVIGAFNNSDNGSASGHVRVFENNANVWQQKGSDIDGVAASDRFGSSVSISADGNTIAVGAPDNNDNGFESGHVRVFQFQGGNWAQIGSAIEGEALSDHSGFSVSLSADGNRVAIGAPDNGLIPSVGSNYGQVRVYENQSNSWVQIGSDLDGDDPEDNIGYAVSLNADGSIVAMGSREHNSAAGQVKVYQYQTNNWVQIGSDIDGEVANDKFGGAVSLNNQGNILAVGAQDHNGIGQVRVFENQSNSWVQIGNAIDGEAITDDFGISVSLNADGSMLAIGAIFNNGFASDAGHVRVYQNQTNNWVQIGSDIDGEALDDRSGRSVSLSDDGSIVAIGAYLNNGVNGSNSGHVRVFSNSNILSVEHTEIRDNLIVYPNPSTDYLHINLKEQSNYSKVQLYNLEGKLLYTQNDTNETRLELDITWLSKGSYILKLEQAKTLKTFKIIKK